MFNFIFNTVDMYVMKKMNVFIATKSQHFKALFCLRCSNCHTNNNYHKAKWPIENLDAIFGLGMRSPHDVLKVLCFNIVVLLGLEML